MIADRCDEHGGCRRVDSWDERLVRKDSVELGLDGDYSGHSIHSPVRRFPCGGWYGVEMRTLFILLGIVIVIVVASNWQAQQAKPTSPPSTPTEHLNTPTERCDAALSLIYIKTGRWVVDGGPLERWHWCQDNQSLFKGDATPPITKKSKKNP
jgi:hypothetical protein